MKVFFLTRTYPNDDTGGAIIRKGTIEYLKKNGYEVWIVVPNYNSKNIDTDYDKKHILYPVRWNLKLLKILESVGFLHDYLQLWAKETSKFLLSFVSKNDLLFATSGGELGPVLLGCYLKEQVKCKLIYNLHDPIGFTYVNNIYVKYYPRFLFHVPREKFVAEIIKLPDAIITSSEAYREALISKYGIKNVHSCYFGYIEKSKVVNEKKYTDKIHIVYGGTLGKLQRVDLFVKEAVKFSNVKVTIIGNYTSNKELIAYRDKIELLPSMPLSEYVNFLCQYADIGLLSLDGLIAELCVPSKFFEYINVGIPILGIIRGDTKKIIQNFEYGIATEFTEGSIAEAIRQISDEKMINKWKNNVLKDRNNWSMEYRMKDFLSIINNVTSNV